MAWEHVALGMIIVIVAAMAYNTWVSPLSVPVFANQTTNQGSTVLQKSDLTAVFLPYFAVTNASESCATTHQGEWITTPDRVGCFNMAIPLTSGTCSQAVYIAAMQQCAGVHATSVCQDNNVGCYYS